MLCCVVTLGPHTQGSRLNVHTHIRLRGVTTGGMYEQLAKRGVHTLEQLAQNKCSYSVHTVFIRCSYGVHIDQSPREFLRALVGKFLKDLGQKTSNSDLKMRCGA